MVVPQRSYRDVVRISQCAEKDPAVTAAKARLLRAYQERDNADATLARAIVGAPQGSLGAAAASDILRQATAESIANEAEAAFDAAVKAADAKCAQTTGVPVTSPLFELALLFLGYHPAGGGFNLTGFDDLAGPNAIDVRNGGASTPYHALAVRLRLYQYAAIMSGTPELALFAEVGYQTFFGRAFNQEFSQVNGVPQGFGEQVYRANWALTFMLGIGFPLGISPFAVAATQQRASLGGEAADVCGTTCSTAGKVMLDVYAGISLTNYTHTLQGNDAGAGAGAVGFFAQANRTNVDPVVGVGVRVPFAVADGWPAMFVGLNAELAWRAGSVLVAQSQNFPSQTYWGTIGKSVDLSASARLGVSF